jgi:hypothetical protein
MIKELNVGPYIIEESFGEDFDKNVIKVLKTKTDFEKMSGYELDLTPAVLGAGTKGDVVTLKDPKMVLKITEDESEATAASRVTRRVPGVYLVDGVYTLTYKWPKFFETPLWFIVQERLKDSPIAEKIGESFSWGKGWFCKTVAANQEFATAASTIGTSVWWNDKNLDYVLNNTEIWDYVANYGIKYEHMAEICKGMNSLHNLKIAFHDVHKGNIMWRTDKDLPVILDLGFSDSAPGKIRKVKLKDGPVPKKRSTTNR